MKRNYNDWMAKSVKKLIPANKIRRSFYETVVNWIDASWNAVDNRIH